MLANTDAEDREILRKEAVRLREKYYGHDVYIRGLIEFTNYCRNNCYYCGIRRDNRYLERYRLTKEEILSCCESGYRLGYRTFVLQGGEDPWFNDDRMEDIVHSIRTDYPDCAITLSVGERSRESYQRLKEAGADRYLLRHETANEAHYRKLHPEEMSLANRKECLYTLKELGYQVGAGFMVGAPGQTFECLAEDLIFLHDLQPEMSAYGVCDKLTEAIKSGKYDVIIINFANPDMVGHTGVEAAAIKAIEVVDECVGRAVEALKEVNGVMFICADHGNAEQLVDYETGEPYTAHTTNPVPFILVNADADMKLREGGALCDIAPTLIELMGMEQPKEMTGKSLIVRK